METSRGWILEYIHIISLQPSICFLILGMFIETIYCGSTGMSTITYAHNDLDRLLMFEVHVWNYENQGANIKVNSKKGPESPDFHWNPEVEIEENTWYKSGCIKEEETEGSGTPCVDIFMGRV